MGARTGADSLHLVSADTAPRAYGQLEASGQYPDRSRLLTITAGRWDAPAKAEAGAQPGSADNARVTRPAGQHVGKAGPRNLQHELVRRGSLNSPRLGLPRMKQGNDNGRLIQMHIMSRTIQHGDRCSGVVRR